MKRACDVNVGWGLSPIFPLSLAAGEGRLRRASRRREQVVMPQRLPPDAEREGVRKMALTVSHRPYHKGLTLAAPIGEIFAGPCNYAQKRRRIDMRPKNCGEVRIEEILSTIGQEALYTTKDFWFAEEHEFRIFK